ncbi:sigma-54-dependent transcriptional regulator [Endothiovibrio diazotrophicus]
MNSGAVLIVEDDPSLSEALCDTVELAGFPVLSATDGAKALEVLEREAVAMVVSDVRMRPMDGHTLLKRIRAVRPELPVVLMTAYGTIDRAVSAMQEGATDYLVKPFEAEVLVEMVERYMPASRPTAIHGVVTEDARTRELLELARRVAQTDVTVMLNGESGSGKEVFARFIHDASPRAEGPFVAINCAAIPENMLEALLFGYEKGAFTGAYQSNPGKFEQAQGGTILLDEISEMDLGLQAKLLRVIQEKEVERIGGRKPTLLDVRVLATTNRNLKQMVADGKFREDLYYRLSVFPLKLAPLRERPGDVAPLAAHFIARHHREPTPPPQISPAAEARLRAYPWPGNVRELDNVIQRALILMQGGRIEPENLIFETFSDLPRMAVPAARIAEPMAPPAAESTDGEEGRGEGCLGDDLKAREFSLIIDALAAGSRKAAAEKLGISPRTLRYKIARMREAGVAIPGEAA